MIYQIIIALFIILTIASLAFIIPDAKGELGDLKKRIASWWLILPAFTLPLIMPGPFFLLFLGLVGFMGFKEYVSMIETRQEDRSIIFLLYLILLGSPLLIWYHYYLFTLLMPFLVFLIISIASFIKGSNKGLVAVAKLYWGFNLTFMFHTSLGFLSMIESSSYYPFSGHGVVLYLVIILQLNDVAQYVWGKLLGGKKICPRISPNKTISGFIGGILCVPLISMLLSPLFVSFTLLQSWLAGFFLCILGFFGDLLISGLKRDLRIKDFGTLLAGHGGILDRIDSLLLASPIFLLFTFVRI